MIGLDIRLLKNSPVDSNCYLVTDPETKNTLIVDPGSRDSGTLISVITEFRLKVDYILLTHEHFDHIWGVNELKDRYNCQIVCSEECSFNIINRKRNLSMFFNQTGFEIYPADISFSSTLFSIDWNGNEIRLIKSPGHSQGSISIMINDALFTGDTIIKDTKTVLKLPDSNRKELVQSLDLLKSQCTETTIIYPGHGDVFLFDNYDITQCI